MKSASPKTRTVSALAAVTSCLALLAACGESSLSPITGSQSLLEDSTPNAMVIRAKEIPLVAGWDPEYFDPVDFFDPAALPGDTLVMFFSNRPLSCAAPMYAVGCTTRAGWVTVVPLPDGADLSDPVSISDTGLWQWQLNHSGEDGCGMSGSHLPGEEGESLTLSSAEGNISAEFAGVPDFQSGDIDEHGNHTDLTYSVNGAYDVSLCGAIGEFDAL